jgi:hypothetical protein
MAAYSALLTQKTVEANPDFGFSEKMAELSY